MKYKRKKKADFWQLARHYLHDYMPITRNLSDKSVEAYKQSLKTYLQYLEEEKSLINEMVGFDAFAQEMNKATPSIDNEEKLWKKEEVKKLLYSLD